jgi:hypothetical protein
MKYYQYLNKSLTHINTSVTVARMPGVIEDRKVLKELKSHINLMTVTCCAIKLFAQYSLKRSGIILTYLRKN